MKRFPSLRARSKYLAALWADVIACREAWEAEPTTKALARLEDARARWKRAS